MVTERKARKMDFRPESNEIKQIYSIQLLSFSENKSKPSEISSLQRSV